MFPYGPDYIQFRECLGSVCSARAGPMYVYHEGPQCSPKDSALRGAMQCEAGRILIDRLGRKEEGELLLEFKKKLENAQRTEPKGGSGGGSGGAGNKGERPLSATSNIYHNITIYANNSVNNNSIQMGGGSSSSKSSGE